MTIDDLWTIVDKQTKQPIPPFDYNPDVIDGGMLVYVTHDAAELAAEHRREVYAIDCEAVRLAEVCDRRIPMTIDDLLTRIVKRIVRCYYGIVSKP